MKSKICVCFAAYAVLFLAGVGALFAQNAMQSNLAVSLDFVPLLRANLLETEKTGLGGALNGELFLSKKYSVGLRLEALTVPDADKAYFGVDGRIRLYFSDVTTGGFFCGMGLGWGGKFVKDYQNNDKLEAAGLTYSLKLGYRHIVVKRFFVEPGFSYTLAKQTAGYGPGGFDLSFCAGFIF